MPIHSSTVVPALPSGGAAHDAPGDASQLHRDRWARGLRAVGFVALLAGALDPLEGSIVILAGSALVALGTFLGPGERRWVVYRTVVFVLIAFGVAALFGLSRAGLGPGGPSIWWGLLALPYLIGWTMGVWGPDSPRWVLWAGLALGAGCCFVLAFAAFEVSRLRHTPLATGFLLLALGAVTLAGCLYRLHRRARQR